MIDHLQEILSHFAIVETPTPHGSGHINTTYLVNSTPKYILQRINTDIFTRPDQVMANIVAVTEYLQEKIKGTFEPAFDRICMHEFVLDLSKYKKETGVSALDVAKSLIDNGMHPPTMYFPLIVHEALMLEPTETESKDTLDWAAEVFRKLYERDYFVAFPSAHPMAERSSISPREVVHEPQVVFNYNVAKSFKEWASGSPTDESVICTVDTARAALDLVSEGIGIAFIPNECVEHHPGVQYVPLDNWHQALYMCILYDKWLEPPVWDFIETIVKGMRAKRL